MEICCPDSDGILASRDLLLQEVLRPRAPLFPVQTEYPIVLHKTQTKFSHCLIHEARVLAHANLWPRVLVDRIAGHSFQMGLVGNVATAQQWRGKGLSRQILAHIEQTALNQGMQALVLWSDLQEFYQNLGFQSCGHEYRYTFRRPTNAWAASALQFKKVPAQTMKVDDLEHLIHIRYAVGATLKRSALEFLELLKIPATHLIVGLQEGQVSCYGLVGKGYDMVDVMHEWGASEPGHLMSLVRSAINILNLDELMLLAPSDLDAAWQKECRRFAEGHERHPMAFIKKLGPSQALDAVLGRTFIWGLDSI